MKICKNYSLKWYGSSIFNAFSNWFEWYVCIKSNKTVWNMRVSAFRYFSHNAKRRNSLFCNVPMIKMVRQRIWSHFSTQTKKSIEISVEYLLNLKIVLHFWKLQNHNFWTHFLYGYKFKKKICWSYTTHIGSVYDSCWKHRNFNGARQP